MSMVLKSFAGLLLLLGLAFAFTRPELGDAYAAGDFGSVGAILVTRSIVWLCAAGILWGIARRINR